MSHFVEKCKVCKKVVSQCRCICCNSKEERWTVCPVCKQTEGEKK